MTIALRPFSRTTAALVITLISAAPAFAEQRSCAEVASLRSGAAETAATIEVTNSSPTPSTIELVDRSGAIADYFTLAPGENRQFQTYRTTPGSAETPADAVCRSLCRRVSQTNGKSFP